MKKLIALLSAFLMGLTGALSAADSTFMDYQNYNHGYCPECNCYPCCCQGGASCPAPTPNLPPPQACPPGQPCPPSCPAPNPCSPPPVDPCAPICGADCGISVVAIGIAVAAVAAAAAIIISTGNGGAAAHS